MDNEKRLNNVDIIFHPDTQEILGASVHYLDGHRAEDFPPEKLNELLPNNPGYAVEIAGLKKQLENSVPATEYEALQTQQAAELAALQTQLSDALKAIAKIREKSAADVMAEFQRRVCKQFKEPDWVSFNAMRSNSLSEVSALLAKKEVTNLEEVEIARLQTMKAGKNWLEAMEAKANEIASMTPIPFDITKDELWALG